jgi:hypothetical protein
MEIINGVRKEVVVYNALEALNSSEGPKEATRQQLSSQLA